MTLYQKSMYMYLTSDFELIIYKPSSCLAHAQCKQVNSGFSIYFPDFDSWTTFITANAVHHKSMHFWCKNHQSTYFVCQEIENGGGERLLQGISIYFNVYNLFTNVSLNQGLVISVITVFHWIDAPVLFPYSISMKFVIIVVVIVIVCCCRRCIV